MPAAGRCSGDPLAGEILALHAFDGENEVRPVGARWRLESWFYVAPQHAADAFQRRLHGELVALRPCQARPSGPSGVVRRFRPEPAAPARSTGGIGTRGTATHTPLEPPAYRPGRDEREQKSSVLHQLAEHGRN